MPFAPNHAASVAFALTAQESLARAAPLILRALPLPQLALLLLQTSLCLPDLGQALSIALPLARRQFTSEKHCSQGRNGLVSWSSVLDDAVNLLRGVRADPVDGALLSLGGHLCNEDIPLLRQGRDLLSIQTARIFASRLTRFELPFDIVEFLG